MSKILCTGGMGYLGSILVPELLHAGHIVTVVDNFMYNQTPLLDRVYSSNLEIIRHDVTDIDFMKNLYPKFDVIIPLACLTGMPICEANKAQAWEVIVLAIEEMIHCIKPETKIIYPNTNSGYGILKNYDSTWSHLDYCTEETPLNPISRYGKFKCIAEKSILATDNAISLRLATVFGASPRMRLDLLVNDFVYRAVNDRFVVLFESHFKRNYIHVRDVAKAFIHCIDNWDTMKNQVYNVGLSSANLSKLELCRVINEYVSNFTYLEAPIGEDIDKRDYIVSNEKIEKTGWKPVFTLQDGIQELIKAYKIVKRNQYANI